MTDPIRQTCARTNTINLRCGECGNAVRAARHAHDPKRAVERVTNECPICNAASGGFEECWYFDAAGNEIRPNEEPFHG